MDHTTLLLDEIGASNAALIGGQRHNQPHNSGRSANNPNKNKDRTINCTHKTKQNITKIHLFKTPRTIYARSRGGLRSRRSKEVLAGSSTLTPGMLFMPIEARRAWEKEERD